MARATKKIYKVRDKRTGKFVALGYNRKATWTIFPGAAIQSSSHIIDDAKNFEVDVFEVVLIKSLDLDGKELQ